MVSSAALTDHLGVDGESNIFPPRVAFFQNDGRVGKTSLVYHLAWMYSELGYRVVAADFDPQANLTSAFLSEEAVGELWSKGRSGDDSPARTVAQGLGPLIRGVGDIEPVQLVEITPSLTLLPGDLSLSNAEDELSNQWAPCLDGKERAFRVIGALGRLLELAVEAHEADLALIDLGPNLGAINRAALIAASHVVFPLAPDLFSLRGLENLGPTLRAWRTGWSERLERRPEELEYLALPTGRMAAAGYVVLQHAIRLDRPVKAYEKWIARIPEVYHSSVLGEADPPKLTVQQDEACLALLKHYRSLMPMAQEARKPMFMLTSADGAVGSHFAAARDAREDFRRLAETLGDEVHLPSPD